MADSDDVGVNATTRSKNVVTDTGIKPRPEQPHQPESPAARENRNTREPDPDTPTTNPGVLPHVSPPK